MYKTKISEPPLKKGVFPGHQKKLLQFINEVISRWFKTIDLLHNNLYAENISSG